MPLSLSGIQRNYEQRFPAQVPFKAAQAFLATAAISLIFGAVINAALLGGALAATSTVIEAAIRPVFTEFFPKNPRIIQFVTMIFSIIVTLNLARSISPWIGMSFRGVPGELPMLVRIVALFTLNYESLDRNVGRVFVF